MENIIEKCSHCNDTRECKKGITQGIIVEIIHSCEYCIAKSNVKSNAMFKNVPCAYCESKSKENPTNKPNKKEGK